MFLILHFLVGFESLIVPSCLIKLANGGLVLVVDGETLKVWVERNGVHLQNLIC